MGVAKSLCIINWVESEFDLFDFRSMTFFRRVSIFSFGSSMSVGGWGGGRFVKVGFWVEGCTDWHTTCEMANMDDMRMPTLFSFLYDNVDCLRVYDFLEEYKSSILYRVSSFNPWLVEKVRLVFTMAHFPIDDNEIVFEYSKDFDKLCVKDIAEDLCKGAEDLALFGMVDSDLERPYSVDELLIGDLVVNVYISFKDELLHEVWKGEQWRIFRNEIWVELMSVAWHPSRFVYWCLDVEEFQEVEERWGTHW